MGITKNKITSGNSGAIAAGAYLKKGGKVGKKKMGTGGAMGNVQVKGPNKAAKATPMKKGGMYKSGGMKKGM